jgi:3-hydroxyacyl-CoA dehydrogenase
MGPLRLLDEVGLDVARHAGAVMHAAFGERLRPPPPITALEATGLLGRKGGRGFYVYEDNRERGVNDASTQARGRRDGAPDIASGDPRPHAARHGERSRARARGRHRRRRRATSTSA